MRSKVRGFGGKNVERSRGDIGVFRQVLTTSSRKPQSKPSKILKKPTVKPRNAFVKDTAFKPGFDIVKF
jgi:hypothetical protein